MVTLPFSLCVCFKVCILFLAFLVAEYLVYAYRVRIIVNEIFVAYSKNIMVNEFNVIYFLYQIIWINSHFRLYKSTRGLSFSDLGACSLEGQGHNSYNSNDGDDDGGQNWNTMENVFEKNTAHNSIIKEKFSAGLAFSSLSPVLMSTRKLTCGAKPLKFHLRRYFDFI